MGLWVSKERKRGRREDRFWGWGAAMDDGENLFGGLEVRERWFWRKRDGFVGFEREEERLVGGSHG